MVLDHPLPLLDSNTIRDSLYRAAESLSEPVALYAILHGARRQKGPGPGPGSRGPGAALTWAGRDQAVQDIWTGIASRVTVPQGPVLQS